MSRSIVIDGKVVGEGVLPYIIAEMSANHNGKIETAFQIIDAAKLSGADAVKLQTYRPETITLNCDTDDFKIKGGLWDGRTLYDLYEEAHTPWEWHSSLFEYARKIGITIFSTPFDRTAVDLLESLNAPAYKIASFEVVDTELIKYVASTGKPLLISTGMADAAEIEAAIEAAREGGCKEIAVLHCVSGYPAPASDYNLRTIPDMIRRFGLVTGLSDHTLDNTTALTSIAMGASIIEKHFTLDRRGGGPDDSFSLEPKDLAALCNDSKTAWYSIGQVDYGRKSSEVENIKFRRSLYFVKNLMAGDVITAEAVRSIRPGFGLPPKMINEIIGRRLNRNTKCGQPVTLDIIKIENNS
jgi:N-acetylneuraminate synthase